MNYNYVHKLVDCMLQPTLLDRIACFTLILRKVTIGFIPIFDQDSSQWDAAKTIDSPPPHTCQGSAQACFIRVMTLPCKSLQVWAELQYVSCTFIAEIYCTLTHVTSCNSYVNVQSGKLFSNTDNLYMYTVMRKMCLADSMLYLFTFTAIFKVNTT